MTTDHELLGGIIADMRKRTEDDDKLYLFELEDFADRLQSLLGGGWLPISDVPQCKAILIHYKNKLGKSRTIKAKFIPKFTVESSGEYADGDVDEYDEANDRYTYTEGFWELIDNWDDFTMVKVNEGEPDGWQPLPLKPKPKGEL